MEPSPSPVYEVREFKREDIPLFEKYFTSRSDEQLLRMGVDKDKLSANLPKIIKLVEEGLSAPYEAKQCYCLLWLVNGEAIGHSNVAKIIYGSEAFMHLHIWAADDRKRGVGKEMVDRSLW